MRKLRGLGVVLGVLVLLLSGSLSVQAQTAGGVTKERALHLLAVEFKGVSYVGFFREANEYDAVGRDQVLSALNDVLSRAGVESEPSVHVPDLINAYPRNWSAVQQMVDLGVYRPDGDGLYRPQLDVTEAEIQHWVQEVKSLIQTKK